jgi:hypothetical protein
MMSKRLLISRYSTPKFAVNSDIQEAEDEQKYYKNIF